MIIAQMLESDGPGGAELVVLRLAIELRRRGHEVVPVGTTNGIGWLGDRWAYRRSRAVVAVSDATRVQLEADLGLRPGVLTLVRNGVPVVTGDRARARAEFGLRDDEVMVLAVGNLDPRKGHRVLLRALQQLTARGLGVAWHLVIAGGRGGPEREPLLAFAAEHGLADRVHVLGQREDVPDLQAGADVFAMPSLWEGLPLALLEAMIAGNACIASRTSGIPEAIVDGTHGVLVPPGDVEALAEGLAPLLRDPMLRARYGAAAYERAMGEFTIEAMTDRYEALLGIGPRAPVGVPAGASR